MRSIMGMIGLLAVLVVGYFIYSAQVQRGASDKPVAELIDLVAVRSDLLSLGRSEKLYLATNGSYASLDQLRQSGNTNPFPEGSRRGYVYEAEVDGAAHFRITAKPMDSSRTDLPTLSIDETMRITR
ncbi:MAG: hypothetical protein LAP85_20435 [Acidobacteriia bacterium]|nr:hypothetical protein [Terriglobia bacterium]